MEKNKILIVEDNKTAITALETVKKKLDETYFPKIAIAESLESAKKIINSQRRDLLAVVSDMQMKEVNSGLYIVYEALQKNIPSFILSGDTERYGLKCDNSEELGVRHGAGEVIMQPGKTYIALQGRKYLDERRPLKESQLFWEYFMYQFTTFKVPVSMNYMIMAKHGLQSLRNSHTGLTDLITHGHSNFTSSGLLVGDSYHQRNWGKLRDTQEYVQSVLNGKKFTAEEIIERFSTTSLKKHPRQENKFREYCKTSGNN